MGSYVAPYAVERPRMKALEAVRPPGEVYLLACSKRKAEGPCPAYRLYQGPLFQKSWEYARSQNPVWIFILSARYGLVQPWQVLTPYDMTLNAMPMTARYTWALRVWGKLQKHLAQGDHLIFLAGVRYREFLIPLATRAGVECSVPMTGLAYGEQIKWLKEHLGGEHD